MATAELETGKAPIDERGSTDTPSSMSEPPSEQEKQEKPEEKPARGFKVRTDHSKALTYNTVVADVQPAIINRFGEIQKLPWLGAAFSLGAVSILPWGRAYGVFNIKWLFIINIVLFEVGSALCGAAPTMDAMIVGRAIAGVGGSGMYVGCITYIAALTTNKERPVYMGLLGMVWGIGTVLGPVVGGAFTESSATWRWAFYINLVIGAIFAPGYFWALPDLDFQASTPFSTKIKQVDWLGMPIFLAAMLCFTMAINFGGSVYAWNSGSEIALWVVTLVLFVAFGFSQVYTPFIEKKDRLYPIHFIRKPLLVNLQVQMFLLSGVMLFARGDSALEAAVRLLPYICMTVTFSLLNGTLMSKLGYYIPWYIFAGITITAGSALMFTIDAATSSSRVYGYSALIGMGVGSAVQAGFPVVQVLVPPEEISNAIGFISVAQSTGITVFYAIAGSVYLNQAVRFVGRVLPSSYSASDIRGMAAGTSSEGFTELDNSIKDEVVVAIIKAMDRVWLLLLTGGAVALILSFFLGRNKVFQ
ncbi:hypothetical protein FQN57_006819 [Myotisia sp. PD_48]|nr:hypothetical protein FQN57_006819 [Myotisia sp. PD_48]